MRQPTISYLSLVLMFLGLCGFIGAPQALAAQNASSPARVRVAIIPLRPDLAPAADLITVNLSTQKNIELLERQQINWVLGELAQSASQTQKQLRLGELLAADGLLFLDRVTNERNYSLTLKLVAVKPGVVISRIETPWPITEPDKWAAYIAEQQASLLPKLFVSKADAIPVSLLSLRSSVITPDTIALDRQLADLLAKSLASQPKIFVLERQRLERLSYEKDWQATNEPFWNGAMVVEGVINPEAVTADALKIKARLTPSQGTPVEVVVDGKRQQMADVINQLTAKVIQALQSKADVSTWDAKAESLQYLEEARWQMRWGFAPEAQQAAESAWALGLHTPEAAALRVEAYSKFLISSFNSWINGVPEARVTADQVYYCRRALENYLELNQFSGGDVLPADWSKRGLNLLRLASMHLDHVNQAGKRDGIKRDDLRPTREKIRALVKVVEQSNPVPTHATLNNGELSEYPEYAPVLMNYGGLWEETYAEGLKNYERGLRAGYYLPLVKRQFSGVRCEMLRTSWSDENLLACGDQWTGLLARLQQDPDKQVRLSAYIIELKSYESDYQFDEVFLKAWQFLKENQVALISGELPGEVAGWFADTRSVMLSRSMVRPYGRKNLIPEFKKEYDQWAVAIKAAQEKRKNELVKIEQDKQFVDILRRLEQFTAEKKRFEVREFFPLAVPLDLERAEKLLTAVIAYESAVTTAPRPTYYLRSQIELVYKKAGRTVPPPIGTTGAAPPVKTAKMESRPASPPVASRPEPFVLHTPDMRDIPRAPQPLSLTNSATVNLPAAVTVAVSLPKGTELRERGWKQWKLMDGRLWVETWARVSASYSTANSAGYQDYTERSLVEINLSAPNAKTVHYTERDRKDTFGSDSTSWNMRRGEPLVGDKSNFVLHKNQLYRMAEGKLWQESGAGLWLPMNVDLPAATRLAVVNNRLLANTPESLLELDPVTGKITVLASLRNKPARTLLDNLPDLAQASLFSGPQGALRVAVKDTVYERNAGNGDWQRVTALTANIRYQRVSPDGLLYEDGNNFSRNGFYALLPGAKTTTGLLSPEPSQFGRRSNTGSWLWAEEDLRPEHTCRSMTLDGAELWMLLGPTLFTGNTPITIDESYVLRRYASGKRYALRYTFKFPANFWGDRQAQESKPELDVLTDGKYLVLVAPAESKAFIVSKAQLDSLVSQQAGAMDENRKARLAFLEKRKLMWEKMFDRNQNGKLEPDERAAMLSNEQVQKNLQELKELNDLQR